MTDPQFDDRTRFNWGFHDAQSCRFHGISIPPSIRERGAHNQHRHFDVAWEMGWEMGMAWPVESASSQPAWKVRPGRRDFRRDAGAARRAVQAAEAEGTAVAERVFA